MAYSCPQDLDGFLLHLLKNDNKFRQQLGNDLLQFLTDPSNKTVCQDIGQLVSGLTPWMQSSNFKVSSNGIEIMTQLIDRLGTDFRPYLQEVLPCTIDRLGDARDSVREKAHLLILKLLERDVLTPQQLLEKLTAGFTHKNPKIREEVLRCLVNTVNEHGAQSMTLSRFIPHIVKLLADPTQAVRDTASLTLVELYKHVGDMLRTDLQKRNLLPGPKLATLLARFDEVRDAGEMLHTASMTRSMSSSDMYGDEVDRSARKVSAPVRKSNLGSAVKKPPASAIRSGGGAGSVDEDVFVKQFEEVPNVQLFTPRELNEHMQSIQEIIADTNKDWNKRTEALKKIRSLVFAGAMNFEEFNNNLRNLEMPLLVTIKDLRSQVVREACITIAFLAQHLGSRFGHAAECLLQQLINLIQNSAKVVSSSGQTSVRFIIQHTHSARLIPIIASNLQSSKSKEIRRACCELLETILCCWPPHPLEKHVALLQESLRRGISDADPNARVSSRRAYRHFRDNFPEQGDALLQSLEPSYRKALQSELGLAVSNSSSSGSLAQTGSSTALRPSNRLKTPSTTDAAKGRKGFRSNSAIDLQAAQRARAHNLYAAMGREPIVANSASLPRPKKPGTSPTVQSPERSSRRRSRSSGVSHSQPTSRSGSPSSKYNHLYGRPTKTRIPRSITGSRDTSRETSPTRSGGVTSRLRPSMPRPRMSPGTLRSVPVMAQRILQQSREAETALADALSPDQVGENEYHRINSPRKMRSLDNHSDDSETSSLCSERSFDSFRRPSDLSSFYLYDDINEIIALCASTTWQERKDGLVSLRQHLHSGALLSPGELKYVSELCTKMFVDSHTKGLSVFLDTVNALIQRHCADLHDWLYVLLQRTFNKLGADLLMSAQNKLQSTLDNIRVSFPLPLQQSCVYRIIVDVHQTPNAKVRVAVLTYLAALYRIAEPAQFVSRPPASQALAKIVAYARDSKSSDVRNAAKLCLLAMWNCSVADVTMMLADLPADIQDIASEIVQSQVRGNNGEAEPPSTSHRNNVEMPSNAEDIYKSLKRTTAEIQHYSYETSSLSRTGLDRERETTSHDSGISQMSGVALEERMENLHLRATSAALNGIVSEVDSTNGFSSKDFNADEVVINVLEYCLIDNPSSPRQKREFLDKLLIVINQGYLTPIISNFKKLLKIFIDMISQGDERTVVIVLKILEAILKPEMEECWGNFIELLTLRVLDAISSDKRDLRIAAVSTTRAMAVFPFDTVLSTLTPLVQVSPYPRVEGVIKMITIIIEQHPTALTDEQLVVLMPGIVKACDHEVLYARKSAVFCMLAIHKAVGEKRMEPHLRALSASKLKLFRIYVEKEQDGGSGSSGTLEDPLQSGTRSRKSNT